ncbi:hypothetical protein [Sphingopyxis sp.]|uniref:hypothetical protein n=1 Tax=Sphingopyxis sp. TaxID=1908224 RepID=UPI0025FF3C94|nr:hypothetical protein [Sphingopyxis sp.]MBK6414249.1 hypothetical protein [Sphingopyxis sp.]
MLGSDEIALDDRNGRPIAPERAITTSLWIAFLIFFAAASGYIANEMWQKNQAELAALSAASAVILLFTAISRYRQAKRYRRAYQLKLSNYEAGARQTPF